MTALFAICDDEWALVRVANSPMGLKAESGKTYSNAALATVEDLRENFVLVIDQGSKPDQEWQTVIGNPQVVIDGDPNEPETMTATLQYTTQPITLEAAKDKLRKKAVHCCKNAMFSGWNWERVEGESYLVQTDEMSRANIAEKGRLADRRVAAADDTLIPFRMADNSTPKITPTEMAYIADTVAILRDDCIENLDAVWASIEALPDLAACMAFDCSTGFPAVPAPEAS